MELFSDGDLNVVGFIGEVVWVFNVGVKYDEIVM